MRRGFCCGGSSVASRCRCPSPVSYTHLDVYKRQSDWRLRSPIRQIRPRQDGLPQSAGSNSPHSKNGNVCIYCLRSLPQPANGSFRGCLLYTSIKTVLIPDENQKDLVEIPDNIKGGLEIKAVKWIDEVLELALTSRPTPMQEKLPVDEKPRRTVRRVLKDVVPAH